MRPKIDMDKIKHLPTAEDMFANEYGAKGTVARDEFDAKSRAWYYAEVLKNARKSAGITQQQLRNAGERRDRYAVIDFHYDLRGCRVEVCIDLLDRTLIINDCVPPNCDSILHIPDAAVRRHIAGEGAACLVGRDRGVPGGVGMDARPRGQ